MRARFLELFQAFRKNLAVASHVLVIDLLKSACFFPVTLIDLKAEEFLLFWEALDELIDMYDAVW